MDDPNPFADSHAANYGASTKSYEPLETPPPYHDTAPADTNASAGADTRSYAHYFQISPEQLRERLAAALKLQKLQPEGQLELEPDLYAPVWVTATVVAALFFAHSVRLLVTALVHSTPLDTVTEYSRLTSCAFLFYAYTGLAPAAVHVISGHVLGARVHVTLPALVCIYGYANAAWVPVAVASSIANVLVASSAANVFGWVCVAAGAVHSGAVLFRQLRDVCDAEDAARWRPVLVAVLAVHAGFACAVKAVVF